jgi:molybdopterin converting factor small subunit
MRILTFGVAREITGDSIIDVIVTEPVSVAALKAELNRQYPGLEKLSSYMIAVNGAYMAGDMIIDENAEIAVIPPVSGG